MALKVRLPLDGNLKNKGLDLITVTNGGATINNYGKTGQCYAFDGSNSYISLSDVAKYFKGSNNPFSVCFWFYHDASSRRGIFFGNYNIQSTTEAFNLEITSDNKFRLWWKGNPNWIPTTFTIESQTWYHITVTYNGTTIKLYVNGVLNSSTNVTLSTLTSTSNYYIGRDGRIGDTAFKGRINEFRIYDHALSVKEIKEIYKSLILHYKLSETSIVNSNYQSDITWNLLINNAIGNTIIVTQDNTVTDERRYVVKSTQISSNRCVYTSGQTIPADHYALVYIKFKSNFTNYPYLRYLKTANPATYSSITISNYVQNEWCEIKRKFTGGFVPGANSGILPANTDYQEAEYFSLPKNGGFMVFDLTQMFGAGNEPSEEEFFKMFPDINYAYDVGTVKNIYEPIYDSSGYERNVQTLVGRAELLDNIAANKSKRYRNSLKLKGSTGLMSKEFYIPSTCTYCLWARTPNTNAKFYIDVRKSNTGVLPAYHSGTTFLVYSSTGGYNNYTSFSLPTNEWFHLAVVLTPTGNKVYVNGELRAQGTTALGMSHLTYITLGMRHSQATFMTGDISDFRLYATELTANDIKDLYTQASIDSKGNLFCYEVLESDTIKINSTGVVESESINEETLTGKQASMLKTGTFKVNQIIEK